MITWSLTLYIVLRSGETSSPVGIIFRIPPKTVLHVHRPWWLRGQPISWAQVWANGSYEPVGGSHSLQLIPTNTWSLENFIITITRNFIRKLHQTSSHPLDTFSSSTHTSSFPPPQCLSPISSTLLCHFSNSSPPNAGTSSLLAISNWIARSQLHQEHHQPQATLCQSSSIPGISTSVPMHWYRHCAVLMRFHQHMGYQ